jgi:hypothetical protein
MKFSAQVSDLSGVFPKAELPDFAIPASLGAMLLSLIADSVSGRRKQAPINDFTAVCGETGDDCGCAGHTKVTGARRLVRLVDDLQSKLKDARLEC